MAESDPLCYPQPVKVAEKWSDAIKESGGGVNDRPAACPSGDRKRHPVLNSTSDLADTQTTDECPSGVRAVRDSATHSVSAQVLRSTI